MAKYKSGFKRKNTNEKTFTYALIGFVSVFIIVILALVINGIANPTLGYNDFNNVHLQNFADVTTQEEDTYFVYFYGINCGYCSDIKEEVLGFADNNEAGIKVYLIESSDPTDYVDRVNPLTQEVIVNPNTGEPYQAAPITDPITGAQVTGTPTMITIVNGNVVDVNVGPNTITDLVGLVNEGAYGFIN
jgi:thiol-disulfide isomerase/thioredoxin